MKNNWPVLAGLISISMWLPATAAPPQPRPIALAECISLALSNNLDLRVERYVPQLALYELRAAQAGYEPMLELSGQHGHDESGSRILSGGFSIPGSQSDSDSFSSGLGGLLPWGMRYDLSASASDRYGKSFFLDINTNLVADPFENAQSTASIGLTQPLLKNFWIDGTRLNIAVAKNRLKHSELGLRQRIIEVVTSVELAYYDLIFARETVKVQEKAVELAARLAQENKRRVEVGALAPLDEKQAEAQAAASRADLLQAQRGLAASENALKRKLTSEFADWSATELQPAEELTAPLHVFDLQNSWSRGLSQRPDLLQARLDLERQGIRLKYDRNQLFPQLDVFGTYGYNGSGNEFANSLNEVGDRERPFYFFGGRFSIPLGNGAARNTYRGSKAAHEQGLLMLKRLEQDILVQIDDAIKLAKASYERIKATGEARQYAEAALQAEQKKLESGKSTSFEVLRLQRDLTTARSDEISALTQYNRNLAQLSHFEASTLDRLGISLESK